ncbi:UNVERIFIED_CONTAM: hypothetical protein HDU68_006576 [Siphonaria sp. JEL0065]|nr:hypothetical protein HDU68_006576 [Siphonaria sp. JEL0065]
MIQNQTPTFRYKILPLLTVRETVYLRVLGEILIKPDWWIKLKDESITTKWRQEIRVALHQLIATSGYAAPDPLPASKESSYTIKHVTDGEFVDHAVEFMFQELAFLSTELIHKNDAIITPTSSHGVFLSDSIIKRDIVDRLTHHAASLEADSLKRNDWHEGSDRKVLNLIHPSNYCVVFGKSLRRDNQQVLIGSAPIQTTLKKKSRVWGPDQNDISTSYQWLPAEFHVSHEKEVTITSYINNLNRRSHPEMYGIIAEVFQQMIPMFELALGSFETDHVDRMNASRSNCAYQAGDRWEWQTESWIHHKFGPHADVKDPKLRNNQGFEEEYYQYLNNIGKRPTSIPGLPNDFNWEDVDTIDTFELHGRTVKVIVKMASIHLTPEKPTYKGGSWHLEGMENEAIAATGILYYSMDNITSSRLTFRHVQERDDFHCDQDDYGGLEHVFGFQNQTTDNVAITGQIEARENLCVVFPNFLHHKVEDFELADKTSFGHRKILVFFLVHPDFGVLSSKNVAMQQMDWVARDLYLDVFQHRLPLEVVRRIVEFTGSTMTAQEAVKVAHEVMEERKNTPEGGYANIQQLNLCEH